MIAITDKVSPVICLFDNFSLSMYLLSMAEITTTPPLNAGKKTTASKEAEMTIFKRLYKQLKTPASNTNRAKLFLLISLLSERVRIEKEKYKTAITTEAINIILPALEEFGDLPNALKTIPTAAANKRNNTA